MYANNNEKVKIIDAHSKSSARKKAKSPSPTRKLGDAKIVDLSELTFQLNYKDEYSFDRHRASMVQWFCCISFAC